MNTHVNDTFHELLKGIADAHATGVGAGAAAVRLRLYPAVSALEREFKEALDDPHTTMKSSLQVAIASVIALVRAEQTNDYANVMVKRDQFARPEGRPEDDMTAHGTPMKAGS